MNYILITHTDLDGTVPIVLAKRIFKNLTYRRCSYDTVNEVIQSVINFDSDSFLFIVDLGISNLVAKLLNERGKVLLVDHHKTSEWIKGYPWVIFDTSKCASFLFYDYLGNNYGNKKLSGYYPLVKLTNDYDLWEHKHKESALLNTLLGLLGHEKFISRFEQSPEVNFSGEEMLLLESEEERRKAHLEKVAKTVRVYNENGYNFGVVFSDKYPSEVGNYIIENRDIDYIFIVDLLYKGVSLRGNGKVDVSEIAKKYGGGGHHNASGFNLKEEDINGIIERLIFNQV